MSIVVLMAASCSLNEGLDIEGQDKAAQSLAVNTSMVKLISAAQTNGGATGIPYTVYAGLTGKIKVKNVAYNKKVFVHMRTVGTPVGQTVVNGWFDAQATYAGPAEAGYEYWTFTVMTKLYKGGQGSYPLFEYVIGYTVNGATYWDNNGGLNYKDSVPTFEMVGLSSADYYTTSNPTPYMMNHVLTGEVLVKNTAMNKTVTIHYVGSDAQWHDAAATYIAPSYVYGNYERWGFTITTPVYKYPPQNFYRFAIKYVVSGATYWDNNGGADYYGMTF